MQPLDQLRGMDMRRNNGIGKYFYYFRSASLCYVQVKSQIPFGNSLQVSFTNPVFKRCISRHFEKTAAEEYNLSHEKNNNKRNSSLSK